MIAPSLGPGSIKRSEQKKNRISLVVVGLPTKRGWCLELGNSHPGSGARVTVLTCEKEKIELGLWYKGRKSEINNKIGRGKGPGGKTYPNPRRGITS